MAWIMKKSATMEIDRREAPYLDEQDREHLEREVLARYPTRQAATLPVLRHVQEAHGWLPYQALEEVAAFLELAPAELYDAASFYEEFAFEPRGRYVIWVCQSIACELTGHEALVEKIRAKLGIEPGETSEDGRFTLMTAECLGSCGTAPVALVNETLHENLTAENLEQVLDGLE